MWKVTAQRSETIFSLLLGLAFASLFFRHGVMHLVAFLFLVSVLIARPRLPWIAPFWWLLLFIIWEWLSNYLGPYHGEGMEGGGIGYHFLFLFLPLSLPVISKFSVMAGVSVGAVASACLIWAQGIIGVDLTASPLRINWDGGRAFARPPGFNTRPWETQFIHSLVSLSILPYLAWRKVYSWFLVLALLSGVILPQIRAVIAAFLGGFGLQLIFLSGTQNKKTLLRRIFLIAIIAVVSIAAMAFLRPTFTKNIATGNGRDKIFVASFEVFKQYPHTGIGGGRNFKEHYLQAWKDLGWHNQKKPQFLEVKIGHAHSDALMLLAHHGWPALFLWTAFILHCLLFVWKNGSPQERTIFFSLVIMHHIAGLAETYLDYSNTTYAIFLCYGLA
ncbi:MAG: hypothetical protein KAU21_04975, partial [Gammaproteobacteria bacterium]|nr:hypothetical protein [Gammaproteobacteria bacterium]